MIIIRYLNSLKELYPEKAAARKLSQFNEAFTTVVPIIMSFLPLGNYDIIIIIIMATVVMNDDDDDYNDDDDSDDDDDDDDDDDN